MSVATFWNGEPTPARRVIVRVGFEGAFTAPWYAGLEGTERRAVIVEYFKDEPPMILDDEGDAGVGSAEDCTKSPCYDKHAGGAWAKVTIGRGSPRYGHRSLPSDSEVIAELDEDGNPI